MMESGVAVELEAAARHQGGGTEAGEEDGVMW